MHYFLLSAFPIFEALTFPIYPSAFGCWSQGLIQVHCQNGESKSAEVIVGCESHGSVMSSVQMTVKFLNNSSLRILRRFEKGVLLLIYNQLLK